MELRERFLKFQHLPKGDSSRKAMEDSIIEDCVPMAKRIAAAVAWRYRKPELAEETWGEGLVLAVRDHDPRRGYLPGYLKARIRALARGILWSKMQTGVSTVLRGDLSVMQSPWAASLTLAANAVMISVEVMWVWVTNGETSV